MNYRNLLAGLLPPIAYSPERKAINAEITGEGNAFNLVSMSADEVAGAATPLFSDGLLADWERVLELTPGDDDSWQQRLEAVLLKLAETGGLSRSYFIKLAATAGYTITIDEFEPFRAGTNSAGDPLYVPEIIYVWAVNVKSSVTVYYFRAGISLPGERLATYGNKVLETIFGNLKPAHTYCYFTYEEQA
ncbi:phage tail protein [Izhakiella australiensis]|uniref:Phage tail protein n=1 Tax=Izhakiella australiensis TaxID=1926881 RepID=A0A1S8YKB1_9GAMM|nr:putative phage tail protein [Izhakiella australiensis]OON39450.1 phage tail protein [Izhakiella australiensis]